jgi:hypothetical protein
MQLFKLGEYPWYCGCGLVKVRIERICIDLIRNKCYKSIKCTEAFFPASSL